MKKINKHLLLAFMAFLLIVTSCRKEVLPVALTYENEASDHIFQATSDEDLYLSAKVVGAASAYQWFEKDQLLSSSPIFKFNRTNPGNYTITLKVTNAGGTTSLDYLIKVSGKYAKGIVLLSSNAADGLGSGNISYINEKGELSVDIFKSINPGKKLMPSLMNMYAFDQKFYVTSSAGTNHITILDRQTLKLKDSIMGAGVSAVTYFATTNGTTGYVNLTNRRKPGFFAVDLTAKVISSTVIDGTTAAPLLPITSYNQQIFSGNGKQLVKLDNNKATVISTYTENVAGAVVANNSLWVAVQGTTANKAKFVKYNADLTVAAEVVLDAYYKIPPNGMITAAKNGQYIYWQETSKGIICRFNTDTKVAEQFVNFADAGITFATLWKVNPKDNVLYVADTPGIFSGESSSTLFTFDDKGKLIRQYPKAGNSIVDIYFNE